MKKRIVWIGLFLSLSLVVVAVRAYVLAFHFKKETSQRSVVRGAIYDRNGFALASTEEASTISVSPHEIYDFEQTAEVLAKYLNMPSTKIMQHMYERKHHHYFYLKRQVDNLQADKILDLKLPGVYREWEYRRQYPGRSLASNLLGFVGRDQSHALAGLERNYNKILLHTTTKYPHGGYALQLSIDSLLQYKLELELGKAYEASQSKRAVAVLIDVHSGSILAMVSLPNFDPNEYYKSTPFQRGNWNIRLNFEPGSTVKVLMAAVILAEKAVDPSQRFLCKGEIHFHDALIRCRYGNKVIRHGRLKLSEIIEQSCNVGIIKAMQHVEPERLYSYMKQLGFGELTGLLPPGSGETSGYFPARKDWVASTLYYMPIGQGFSVTPIQLLRAGASLINGGKLFQPFVAWRILSPDNHILNEKKPNWKKSPFDESVREKIRRMMIGVVKRGTGKAARTAKIGVMGKTGTGEKSSAHGYLNKYVASFMGFFPTKKLRYGLLLLFDEPKTAHSGGSLAAPVFSRFVRSIRPFLEQRARSVSPDKLPRQPIRTWKIHKEKLYDFRGLAARDAVQIINGYYKLKVKLMGSGYVYRQVPKPGGDVRKIKMVQLYLREH